MATVKNNFDQFVKRIQEKKKKIKSSYESSLDDPYSKHTDVQRLYVQYHCLCDILNAASSFSYNNVDFDEE